MLKQMIRWLSRQRQYRKYLVAGIFAMFVLGLYVKAQSSPAGFNVSWTASVPIAPATISGYYLQRCQVTATELCEDAQAPTAVTDWTIVNTTPITALTYLDSSFTITPNATYVYVVYAEDSTGQWSGISQPFSVTAAPSAQPSAPTITGITQQ